MAGPGALLIDLGNRRIKCARAEAGAIGAVDVFDLDEGDAGRLAAAAAWLEPRFDGAAVWICSTHPAALTELQAGPLAAGKVVGPDCWPIAVASSRGTGADRVVAAYAAWSRAGGAVLVADLGTAFTLDAVSAAGEFQGGAIGAGLGLQQAALAAGAPHLDAAAGEPGQPIPRDTADAVALGTAGALAAALGTLAARFERHMGGAARRFVTGGDAQRMAAWLGPEWTRVEHLVLEGLARMATAS